jgi:hypothetical protein
MTEQIITQFFAWFPLFAFSVLLVFLYAATRGGAKPAPAARKTYACAQCGRRGSNEHMVPVTREGAVVWYCARCAGGH